MSKDSQENHKQNLTKLKAVCKYAEKVAHDISSAAIEIDLERAILISSYFSSIRNAKSIIALASSGAIAGVNSIHRTMIEELINAKFVVEDKSGIMAKAFLKNGEESLARNIRDMIKYGVASKLGKTDSEWKAKLTEIEARIKDLDASEPIISIKWPRKKHRADSTGLIEVYLTTEWLFSQEIHGTTYSLDKFLKDKSGTVIFDIRMIDETQYCPDSLESTVGLLSAFMHLCADELGTPSKVDVAEFMESLSNGNKDHA